MSYLHQKPAFHRYECLNSHSLVPQTDQYDALWLKKQKQTNQNKFTKQNETKERRKQNKQRNNLVVLKIINFIGFLKTLWCSLVSNIFFCLFGYTHLQVIDYVQIMQVSILSLSFKLDLNSFPLWETWHFALWKNDGYKTVLDMHWLVWKLGNGLISEIHD